VDYRRVSQILVFVAAFIAASYLAHRYQSTLELLLGNGGFVSIALFIFITAVFVVFVIPLDIVFLIPLGAHLWGPVPTALMSIAGWVIGASVTFWIARTWGLPLVQYMIGEERVLEMHESVPQTNLFWSVVLLRMLIPVDILSYALGLFSRMSWQSYIVATALGVAPFGFFFSYAGTLPPWYQVTALLGAFALVFFMLFQYRKSRVLGGGQSRSGQE
jgi:uncharacterized membrane protein YdjX (TVP38/TMEM64 family)